MTPPNKEPFEELLAKCADEPIRFPGAIQPHGLLLTLSEPALEIIQISANVETLLAHTPQELIGQPLHKLIGQAHTEAVREALVRPAFADAGPLHVHINGTTFEGLLHRHQGVLILELEIHVEISSRATSQGSTPTWDACSSACKWRPRCKSCMTSASRKFRR